MKPIILIAVVVVVALLAIGLMLQRQTPVTEEDAAIPLISPESDLFPPEDTDPFVVETPTSATPAASPTAGTTAAVTRTIAISDTGFSPAAPTIPVGTTVVFTNNGQAAHWPASDVHPTHELLPGFDAKRGLNTGESFSFTFTEVGTWPFHDHMRPSLTGTITVE